jgi:hypothetical protein
MWQKSPRRASRITGYTPLFVVAQQTSIADFRNELHRYRDLAEKAMAQVPDDALNRVPYQDANSIAMVVRHISGNLRSRFTDFLISDGEKPWRDRDSEFVERPYVRDELRAMWDASWQIVESTLATLTDAQLGDTVSIRGVAATVHEALCRATTHISYHVGQIVLLCRMYTPSEWTSLSIPKKK